MAKAGLQGREYTNNMLCLSVMNLGDDYQRQLSSISIAMKAVSRLERVLQVPPQQAQGTCSPHITAHLFYDRHLLDEAVDVHE